MRKRAVALYVIIAVLALMFEYYAYQPLTAKVGELSIISWQQLPTMVAENVKTVGKGNSVRPVLFSETSSCLELVSGNEGSVEYRIDVPVVSDQDIRWRTMFLSMQGNGRVEIRGFDSFDKLVATSCYIFSGDVMPSSQLKMHSERSKYNFVGGWVEERKNIGDVMREDFASEAVNIKRLELTLIVENGQHALIEDFSCARDNSKALIVQTQPIQAIKGEQVTVFVPVRNISNRVIKDALVKLATPSGFGIIPASKGMLLTLNPGEEKILELTFFAKRSSEVNLKKPWQVGIMADGQMLGQLNVDVIDDKPGKIFYVMTDDLEVIDAAGYPKPWGERQSWITSEEIYIQMKSKSEELNAIADRYNAHWTHYIAWPIIRAAQEMAIAGCSGWQDTVAAVTESVRTQSERGHEYGLHMHSDYDPLLPGNSLSINYQKNGFWANHLRHGWAHSIKSIGGYDEYDSRTGILFSYISELQKLTEKSPLGTSISARAGSFDYGVGAGDQTNSYLSYRKVGLFGSSDAPGNLGEFVSADYGKEIYFSRPDAIEKTVVDLSSVGLVEFLPTPIKRIEYDCDSLTELNQKVDLGVSVFTDNILIRAGVHAIIGFTHAMFVMGDGDWKSTSGGAFDKIANHLDYVYNNYVVSDRVKFATASQLVKEYLDYYSPQPIAITEALIQDNAGCAEYKVAVLGKDIIANSDYQHLLKVKFPLQLRSSAYAAAICKNGEIIAYYYQLPVVDNDLEFVYNDSAAAYTVRIWHDSNLSRLLVFFREIAESFTKTWISDKKLL
ncbi:MAG: hypothetical protein WCV63_06750 [Negativicutes bacterium]